jgi:hypothetical protein
MNPTQDTCKSSYDANYGEVRRELEARFNINDAGEGNFKCFYDPDSVDQVVYDTSVPKGSVARALLWPIAFILIGCVLACSSKDGERSPLVACWMLLCCWPCWRPCLLPLFRRCGCRACDRRPQTRTNVDRDGDRDGDGELMDGRLPYIAHEISMGRLHNEGPVRDAPPL